MHEIQRNAPLYLCQYIFYHFNYLPVGLAVVWGDTVVKFAEIREKQPV